MRKLSGCCHFTLAIGQMIPGYFIPIENTATDAPAWTKRKCHHCNTPCMQYGQQDFHVYAWLLAIDRLAVRFISPRLDKSGRLLQRTVIFTGENTTIRQAGVGPRLEGGPAITCNFVIIFSGQWLLTTFFWMLITTLYLHLFWAGRRAMKLQDIRQLLIFHRTRLFRVYLRDGIEKSPITASIK